MVKVRHCIVLVVALLGGATSAAAFEPVAEVTGFASVEDGDGILFGDVEIRLQGVAAPELGESMGRESYLNLVELADGLKVRCELDGTTAGRSKRPVGVCYVGSLDLGMAQVEQGMARDCPRFSKGRYAEAERQARAAGRDLSLSYRLPDYC